MIRISTRGVLLLLVSALVVPGASRAAENQQEALPFIQLGPVIVHPFLSLQETYSDNVYFSEKNTESDFITSVRPGVTLNLPFRMHELGIGASAETLRYAENTDLNATPYQVFGLADFSFGDRVQLKVGDTYQRVAESPMDSPNNTLEMYTDNLAALSVKYAFADVSQVQVDYSRTTLDYDESTYRTRDEDLVSVYLYYRTLPVTSAFLEYDFKKVAYESSKERDNEVQTGLVGATWEISEISKGTAKVGYLSKDYADASSKDFTTWTASVDLKHSLSDAAAVQLLGKRDVNEGKDTAVRYYTTSGVYVEFTYHFLDRLAGILEGSYSQEIFSDPQPGGSVVREDITARTGIGAKYSFNSWLDISLRYNYVQRDSNIASYDGTVNSVSLTAAVQR